MKIYGYSVIFVLLCLVEATCFLRVHAEPEAPINIWPYPPLSMLREGNIFSYPHLPPFRLNRDGRLGLRVGEPGRDIELFLLSPEVLSKPLLLSEAGIQGLGRLDPYVLPVSVLENQLEENFLARAICDPDQRQNPYLCGENDEKHCYDVTIVGTSYGIGSPLRFASVDLKIAIDQPHSAQATIDKVEALATKIGTPIKDGMDALVEPSITGDGMLWVGKFTSIAKKRWIWKNPSTGKPTFYSPQARPIVYSMNSKGACDIEGWSQFSPLSHAPYDPSVNNLYGFARYPIRDPEGNPIGDGAIIAADQYPWISRDGSMLFLELGGDMLFYYDDKQQAVSARYPVRCARENDCYWNKIKGSSNKEGILALENHKNINRDAAMLGAWTHGKMVIVDNALNYMDYGPNDRIDQHFYVSLYDTSTPLSDSTTHKTGEVLMANNKQLSQTVRGTTNEGAQLGSVENRFNHIPQMKPLTPRDVVWLFSKGNGATVELVFDDFIAHDTLIYSPMNASFTNADALSAEIQGTHSGFTRTGDLSGTGYDGKTPIRIQNTATSDSSISSTHSFMKVPAYGDVEGSVRIEPYALGGIQGKGLWLDGQSRLVYTLPEQSADHAYDKKDWYVSIFLDNRAKEPAGERTVLIFPDGSRVAQQQTGWFFRSSTGKLVAQYLFAEQRSPVWQHLGLRINSSRVDVYHNGEHVYQFPRQTMFSVREGELLIGAKRGQGESGFLGWIDDVKVVAVSSQTSQEVFCEHARGTLISVKSKADTHKKHAVESKAVLLAWQRQIASLLNPTVEPTSIKCFTDYFSEHGANYASLPHAAKPLRELLLQPKFIVDNNPRPDESTNVFCLSCHAEGLHTELSIDALKFRDIPAIHDPRRQPLQPLPMAARVAVKRVSNDD